MKLKSTKTLKDLVNISSTDTDMTEKQISILSAAIELFSEKGYEATATSEIAKKAKVAEGTIFRYYKTKKELLYAIPNALSKISLFEIFLEDFYEIYFGNLKYDGLTNRTADFYGCDSSTVSSIKRKLAYDKFREKAEALTSEEK